MKKLKSNFYILYSALIACGILIDQLSKWLAVKYLTNVPTVPLIEGVLHLTYVENRGAAFGILSEHRWVFITVSLIAIGAIFVYLFFGYSKNNLYSVSLAIILSGGIGNMIDRIVLGYVVDFIDFRLINFAVFNGADSFVCVGAGLLILSLILDMIKEYKKAKADKE